jgi:hypothetical protein
MPTFLTEGTYSFEFLVGDRTSLQTDSIVLAAGQNLAPGALLAKTFVGTATGANAAGNTGNPTIGVIAVGAKAEAGEYLCRFTGATTFGVYSPSGAFLGNGTTGAAFVSSDRLSFTITAGGTAAVAGDTFVILVVEGASTYKAATGSDAVAILGVGTDATGGATTTLAVTRLAEFHTGRVSYNGMDAAHKAAAHAALARRHIIARGGI